MKYGLKHVGGHKQLHFTLKTAHRDFSFSASTNVKLPFDFYLWCEKNFSEFVLHLVSIFVHFFRVL